ncbi:pilus assembly protein [Aliidiomarina minuta]|uniref:Pilus assembly protein n=1 Tax=Aliidiomarina minuta TaxID=880057 RepID=A0A432W5M3_9GAMM|nr:pilus assembly protein [Aliidiomarina minuta]RUO25342.1 pilus assembly protein [Aliidiomarina minuta]
MKARQTGQGMTEYIIVLALIAIAAIGVYSFLGKSVRNQVAGVAQEISGRSASAEVSAAQQAAQQASTSANRDYQLGNYDEGTEQGN